MSAKYIDFNSNYIGASATHRELFNDCVKKYSLTYDHFWLYCWLHDFQMSLYRKYCVEGDEPITSMLYKFYKEYYLSYMCSDAGFTQDECLSIIEDLIELGLIEVIEYDIYTDKPTKYFNSKRRYLTVYLDNLDFLTAEEIEALKQMRRGE